MYRREIVGLILVFFLIFVNGICYACDPLKINLNYHYVPTQSYYIPIGSSDLQINLHVTQGDPVTTWGAPGCETGLTYSSYSADDDDMHIYNVSMSSTGSLDFSVYVASDYDEVTKYGTVHAVDVDFYEGGSNSYGFDSYTGYAEGFKFKSVAQGVTDHLLSTVDDESFCSDVYYVSSNPSIVGVEPDQPEESPQTITVAGISSGAPGNSWIDVKMGGEDSYYDFASLNVRCYDLVMKTVAVRVVHEQGGYTSNDPYTDTQLSSYLFNIYKQGVVFFSVTKLDPMTVNFDLNNDGWLDDSSWMTNEMKVIRDQCKDDTYDFNIFLVNKPLSTQCGFMEGDQRYGFVYPDNTLYDENTTAHELGHGAFDLADLIIDTDNLMYYSGDDPELLRVLQWDAMHPDEEEE